MNQVKCLDLSFSPIPNVGWVERRKAEGIEAIFQCVWTGGYANNDRLQLVARPNLEKILMGGCIPAVYSNAAPWRLPTLWYNESLRNMGGMEAYVEHAMVDVEISDPNAEYMYPPPAYVQEFIRLWESTGRKVCTYSADWFVRAWKTWLGKAADVDFGRPYVPAKYDNIADYTVNPPVHPLGPVAGKQYKNTHTIEGVQVDALVIDGSFFGIGGDEDDMFTDDDRKLLEAIRRRVEGHYVKVEGTTAIYKYDGEKLVHQSFAGLTVGEENPGFEDIAAYPEDHLIWRTPVYYPAGVPDKMRR